jgi:hypothetical protein
MEWGRLLAALLMLIAIAAEAQARSITLRNVVTKFADAVPVRKIMIGSLGGPGGRDLGAALETSLPATMVNGQPYFSVVGRPPGGVATVTSANLAGAEALLWGTMGAEAQEGPFQGLGLSCLRRSYDGKCAKMGMAPQTCMRRAVRVTAQVQLLLTTNGRPGFSTTKMIERSTVWCAGQAPTKNADMLIAEAVIPLARAIAQELAPTVQKVELKIMDDDKALPKEARANLRAAARASSSNLQAACTAWRALNAAYPDNAATVFNLGVCAEVDGDLPGALAQYLRAGALLPPGDVDTATAMSRTQVALATRDEVAKHERERQATLAAHEEMARRERERQVALAAEVAREAARANEARRGEAAKRTARAKTESDAKEAQLRAKDGASAPAISRGQVLQKGMTPAQVTAAKGKPYKTERMGPGEEQWYYPGLRVIFTGGRVSYIGS